MKPFIVCHMMASLDGRIDCDMLAPRGMFPETGGEKVMIILIKERDGVTRCGNIMLCFRPYSRR